MKSEGENAKNGLLIEGVKSYAEALLAINEFQSLIADEYRKVVGQHLKRLATASRVSLTTDDIKDFGNFLDRKIKVRRYVNLEHPYLAAIVELADCQMYFGLYWDKTASLVYVVASLERGRKEFENAALEKLKKKGHMPFRDRPFDSGINFVEKLDPKDAYSFPQRLNALVEKWIAVFNDVGGIPALTT